MSNLAVYIHYPFCAALCPYCDFNVYVKQTLTEADYCAGVQEEIEMLAREGDPHKITSIFFGGGTPSLLSPSVVEKIIGGLAKNFSFDDAIEISLEANPEQINPAYLSALAAAGVGRLSLGIQSLDDDALKFLGRTHTKASATQALTHAREVFSNLSFDLIYARPQQTAHAWEAELKTALAFSPAHLSLYQLEIHPATAFWKKVNPPDPDQARTLWLISEALCAKANLMRYEISNYAKSGFQSKHNLAYWLYQNYIGFGPGAHGRFLLEGKRFATQTPRKPARWFASAQEKNFTEHFQPLALSSEEENREKLLMGLRLVQGVDASVFSLNEEKLRSFVELGLMVKEENYLKTTQKGALLLDHLTAELI